MLHIDTFNNLKEGGVDQAIKIIIDNIGIEDFYSPLSMKSNTRDEILRTTPFIFLQGKRINKLIYTDKSLFNFNFMLNELLDTKIMFIDTETTALKRSRQPVQITAIVTDCHLNVLDQRNFYIHRTDIDPESISIHKLTPDFLKANETPKQDIFDFFEKWNTPSTIVTGYNVSFDIDTLYNFFTSFNKDCPKYFYNPYCIYKDGATALKLYPSLKSKKLVDVIYKLKLDPLIKNKQEQIFGVTTESHDARYDTVAILLLLREFYKMQGVILNWDI